MTNVPSLGTEDHIELDQEEQLLAKELNANKGEHSDMNEFSKGLFTFDSTINPHPRFSGLVKSIRQHRGEKVEIRVPIFKDEKTNLT